MASDGCNQNAKRNLTQLLQKRQGDIRITVIVAIFCRRQLLVFLKKMQGFPLRARIFFFVSCGGYTISLLWLTLSRKFTGSLQYFNIHCRVNSQLSLTVFSCKKGVMPGRLVKIPKVKIKPHNFIRRHVHPIHTSSHIFF